MGGEKEKHQCVSDTYMGRLPQAPDWAQDQTRVRALYWDSTPKPFGAQADTLTTGLHRPGLHLETFDGWVPISNTLSNVTISLLTQAKVLFSSCHEAQGWEKLYILEVGLGIHPCLG